ncbi:MAG: cyclic pyranopterin monophosphate synthase MoaC [Deltaproteobacteria bacterium]|nr:cyclic pyranopterin monophosphate synthase MoaC [Deltaproteobacteria bacterium]
MKRGQRGRVEMIDVGDKPPTTRTGVASGFISMKPATLRRIRDGSLPKGDVLAVARIAGIQAAKRTPEWLPLCHPLPLSYVAVELQPTARPVGIRIRATVRCTAPTGVEMEALTAVAAAALTIYDMVKSIDRGMEIGPVRLERKEGGRSGLWRRNTPPGRGRRAQRPRRAR